MKFILLLFILLAASTAYPFAEFVANCPYSHRLWDDPIVFPGQVNRSHLHYFFSSPITNAFTSSSCQLLNSTTNCDVIGDKSSYWIPALLDPLGNPVSVRRATFYYQSRNIADPTKTVRLPNGLKMLSGDATATTPNAMSPAHWGCTGEGISGFDIVQCSAGNPNLEIFIQFPECWNGIDFDSIDHKSHLAYPTGGICPSTHPVQIPMLEFKIVFNTIGGPGFRLSSGPGYTLHGDAWIAWVDADQEMRVANCIRTAKKCGANGLPNDGSAPIYPQPPNINTICDYSLLTTTASVTTGPVTTSRVTTGPVTTGPATTASITTTSITTGPATTASVTTGQVTTASITTGPVTTGPVTTGSLNNTCTIPQIVYDTMDLVVAISNQLHIVIEELQQEIDDL